MGCCLLCLRRKDNIRDLRGWERIRGKNSNEGERGERRGRGGEREREREREIRFLVASSLGEQWQVAPQLTHTNTHILSPSSGRMERKGGGGDKVLVIKEVVEKGECDWYWLTINCESTESDKATARGNVCAPYLMPHVQRSFDSSHKDTDISLHLFSSPLTHTHTHTHTHTDTHTHTHTVESLMKG